MNTRVTIAGIVLILVLISSLVVSGCVGTIYSQEEYDKVYAQLALVEEQNEILREGISNFGVLTEHIDTVLTDWAKNQSGYVPSFYYGGPGGLDKCIFVFCLEYTTVYDACVEAHMQNVDCYGVAQQQAEQAWASCKAGYPTDYSYLDGFYDHLYQ